MRPSTGLVSLAGTPPPRPPRLRAPGASWLVRNGHPPALPPVPRAHRPNAVRPPVRPLLRLRLVRPQGLRVHRFTGWRAGGGAFRRGCARTGLRSWLRHPSRPRHPANLPAPPFAVRDCDASGSALVDLPGHDAYLRFPTFQTRAFPPNDRKGSTEINTFQMSYIIHLFENNKIQICNCKDFAAIEESIPGKGAAVAALLPASSAPETGEPADGDGGAKRPRARTATPRVRHPRSA